MKTQESFFFTLYPYHDAFVKSSASGTGSPSTRVPLAELELSVLEFSLTERINLITVCNIFILFVLFLLHTVQCVL